MEYIREAIRNEEEGNVWKPQRSGTAKVPDLLAETFRKDEKLKIAFEKLAPFKQKEYIEYITSAKREETKKVRLEKIIPMILQNVGLHDKYKNC